MKARSTVLLDFQALGRRLYFQFVVFRLRDRPDIELWVRKMYHAVVKPTIEYDETRLKRVMKLTGLKSRAAALDYALHEAEQAARVRKFLKSLLSYAEYAGAVAPGYDVLAVREKETPYRA